MSMLPTMLTTLGHVPGAAAAADGCDVDEPGVVGQVQHPIDARAVVLQMSAAGGFVPEWWTSAGARPHVGDVAGPPSVSAPR